MKKPLEEDQKQKLLVQVKEELDKEKARKANLKEAGWAGISQGAGYSYINPFAIALGASNSIIALLTAVPWTISPLAQLFGAKETERQSRIKTIVKFIFLETIFWIGFLILAIFAWLNQNRYQPIILLGIYIILTIFHGFGFPSWFSWIGDIVPEKIRGRFFSKRNRILGTLSLITMLIASFLLDYFKTKGLVFIGFAIIFLIASIARFIVGLSYIKQYEPKSKIKKSKNFEVLTFLKSLPSNNLGKFTLFGSLMKLSAFIAAPFFAVYVLRDLQLSYLWFTLITISTTLFTLISIEVWGRFADKYGNKTLLKISGFLLPLVPILWVVSPNPIYLIFVPQAVAGIAWAAFNLGSADFFFDAVPSEKRPSLIAYYNLLIGAGILIGSLLGSTLIKFIPITFMNKILFIFLISGVLRAVVAAIFIPIIKEPRKVRKPKDIPTAIIREIKPLHIEGLMHHPTWLHHKSIKKELPENPQPK
jgi:MFS family permease